VTSIFVAPILAAALLKVGRPDGLDTSSLWNFVISGDYFPKSLLLELRNLLPGTFVFNAYGQTEVSGILTVFKSSSDKEALYLHSKPTSVGLIIAGIKAKVVDVYTGAICGPNEEGELRIKSDFLMSGYHNHDTSDSFDSDGWMKTGDIVNYDKDGCFYIKDRIKEMLKYKGFQIAPAMLEQLIMTHSSVAQVVIIGIPHDADGDHPMAVIVPKESSTASLTEEDIIKFVDERVSDTMRLRAGVKFVSSIPLTPSGKIRRRDVKKMVLDGNL
uniref:4-coumarate--CoA ligase-like 7 n=1 Tax=Diabrotica virgifera virgifera TaxID=50390 RepID=A0A6P7GFQ1_DIAVI